MLANDAPSGQASERLFDEATLRRLERLALAARKRIAGQMQGERRSPKRGQSVEFADFRPYSRGDDIRRIDWNAYARLERFFLKLFVEEEDLTVHVLVDTSRSMAFGEPQKLAYARKLAGALSYIALSGLDRVTVRLLGEINGQPGQLTPRRGKGQALSLFRFLTGTDGAGQANLAGQLRGYAAAQRPGPLLLISDLLEDGWQAGVNTLAGRGFDVNVLQVLSPEEVRPQISGDLRLKDAETGTAVEVTVDDGMLARYAENLQAWQEEARRFCSARGMIFTTVETSLPVDDLLFGVLLRRGVLR